MRNPFFNDETESYKIEEIYEWFVGDETVLSQLYKPKHNFICGDRGTGKSMLMRYLEPYCQFKANGGWKSFLEKDDSFIAFYIPIPKNLINIKVFQSSDLPVSETIFAHYFNMLMTESIINTMQTQLCEVSVNDTVKKEFVKKFVKLLNPLPGSVKEIDRLINRTASPFEWILSFVDKEKNRITNYINYFALRKIEYRGSLSDYHTFVLPFVKLIKKLYDFDNSIYLLIDDAGNVFDFQQKTFNSWIANRNHHDLSIKLSTVMSYYKTFLTLTGDYIDGKNDFQYIHLDNYGSKSEVSSSRELKKIIDKRLKECDISYDSNEFFEIFPKQKTIMEQARLKAEELAKNRNIADEARYVNRYTMREFYNILSDKSKNKRISISRKYCGIDDIISFSSYNIRYCLKTCSMIFDEVYPNVTDLTPNDIRPIPSEIQDNVINKLSKSEVVSITLFKEHYNYERIYELKQLIISLGTLFRKRLLDYECAEYGVTAFQTSMSDLTAEEREVIKIGVEQCYFLRRFYSDKDGSTINTAYALNKMFFPYFKLELAPFAGRIKINHEDFKKALISPKEFEEIHKSYQNEQSIQLTLFDISEKEEGIDDIKNNLSELF